MASVKLCRCGVPVNVPFHSCAYVQERESLIPLAVRAADMEAGKRPVGEETTDAYEAWVKTWNLIFHSTMNVLWMEYERKRKAAKDSLFEAARAAS